MGKIRRLRVGGENFSYDSELPAGEGNIWMRQDLQPNKQIQKIYSDYAVTINGKKIKLTSAISPAEGFHLYNLINRNKFTQILEIGTANGLSSLYITQALADTAGGKLTSIDPFQSTQWMSAGMINVIEAGLSMYHELIEKKSYEALPELLKQGKSYDMIFIDGMHLFDYTLVDFFYSTLLCKKGGVIVVDDVRHKAPNKVIRYIDANYSFMRRLTLIPTDTVATYLKIGDDTREWNFHEQF